MPSTKIPRFRLAAAGLWLFATAAPAFAQDVTFTLNPAQVAEITRLIDQQPIGQTPPPAFWEVQAAIDKALQANPEALRAVLSARRAAR
jgi:hypothetical protein